MTLLNNVAKMRQEFAFKKLFHVKNTTFNCDVDLLGSQGQTGAVIAEQDN